MLPDSPSPVSADETLTDLPVLCAASPTAEDVKDLLRRYYDAKFPGRWACASASVRLGAIGASVTETLVVLNEPLSACEVPPVRAR